MSNSLQLVANDTGPDLTIVLTDSASGNAIDLTGGVLTGKWRARGTTALLLTTGMTFTLSGTPTNGTFVLVWGSTALVQAPNAWYELEITITQGGKIVTVQQTLNVYLKADF